MEKGWTSPFSMGERVAHSAGWGVDVIQGDSSLFFPDGARFALTRKCVRRYEKRADKNKAPCMGETWGHGKEGWEVLNWSKYILLYNVMQQKKFD